VKGGRPLSLRRLPSSCRGEPPVRVAAPGPPAGRASEPHLPAPGLSPGYAPAHYNLPVLDERPGGHARAVEHFRAFLEHAGGEYAARAGRCPCPGGCLATRPAGLTSGPGGQRAGRAYLAARQHLNPKREVVCPKSTRC
jgi:hypothetical protein